jgi:hypothetical protein
MSIDLERRPLPAVLRPELRHELNALRGNWSWFVLVGVVLLVLGTIALGSVMIASLAAAVAIGVLLLLGGAAEVVGAFWCHRRVAMPLQPNVAGEISDHFTALSLDRQADFQPIEPAVVREAGASFMRRRTCR